MAVGGTSNNTGGRSYQTRESGIPELIRRISIVSGHRDMRYPRLCDYPHKSVNVFYCRHTSWTVRDIPLGESPPHESVGRSSCFMINSCASSFRLSPPFSPQGSHSAVRFFANSTYRVRANKPSAVFPRSEIYRLQSVSLTRACAL